MKIKTVFQKSSVQVTIILLLSLGLSIGILAYYWYFVSSNYLKLVILYMGSTFLFAAAGLYTAVRFKRYAFAVPLFLISFCWLSFYLAQRLSGTDFFYDKHLQKMVKEAYEKQKESKKPEVAKSLLEQGRKLISTKNYRNAERYLTTAAEFDKNNPDIYFALGDLYSSMNNPYYAVKYYSAGLEMDFKKPEIHLKVGILSYQIGEIDLALSAFKTAAYQDTSNDKAAANYVALSAVKNSYDKMASQGMLQVSQIVLPTREQAQQILKRALDGEHFGMLAYAYSIDEITKKAGGMGPFFDPNKNEYVFSDIVKKMKIGDIRGVLEYDGKYFIIKRLY